MTKKWIPTIKDRYKNLYLEIASQIAAEIANGNLPPHSRLPTQRELADELGVAIGTVTRAYSEAEKRGLIYARGRKGTFVGSGEVKGSTLESLVKPGSRKIDFSMVHPLYGYDPDLGNALENLSRRADVSNLLMYPPPDSNDRHKQAGVEWIKRLGIEVPHESVITSTGGQNGLFLILKALTEPGDKILVEELVYPGIKSIAEILKLKLIGVKMDEEGVLPGALEASYLKSSARLLFCNPDLHNPTTSILSESRRQEIAELAQKLDITIIEDTIHRPLLTNPPKLIANFAPEKTILLTSISKTVAGGLRVGFISSPKAIVAKLKSVAMAVNFMPAPLPFEIFATWIEDDTISQVIETKRREILSRQKIIKEILGNFKLKTNACSHFSWLELPERINQIQFCNDVSQLGVSIANALVFSIDKTNAPEAVRICISTPEKKEKVTTGLEIIARVLKGEKSTKQAIYL